MPITSSAKKALRASKNKRVYNIRRKSDIAEVTKNIKKLVLENKIKEAEKLLPTAYKAIDKAWKTNMIKKNNAANKKSSLAKAIVRAKAAKK